MSEAWIIDACRTHLDGRYGLITMCAAGGMAPAIVVERLAD